MSTSEAADAPIVCAPRVRGGLETLLVEKKGGEPDTDAVGSARPDSDDRDGQRTESASIDELTELVCVVLDEVQSLRQAIFEPTVVRSASEDYYDIVTANTTSIH